MTHDDSIPASDPTLAEPKSTSKWRRPALVVTGLSLLTLGAVLNADRLHDEPERASIEEELEVPAVVANEEGRMGKPSSKSKSGIYAMKGPREALPTLSSDEGRARSAGILGQMQQEGGHFLASPHGGAYAVGNDDADIWGGLTGTEVGEAYGVGGLGLVGTGTAYCGTAEGSELAREFVPTSEDAKSTFSIDVDTASYALVRRSLAERMQLPDPSSVRTEELINYFDYDYPQPVGDSPFAITTELGPSPWSKQRRLVHIGLRGAVPASVPARNLVYLIDASGSMSGPNKLDLVKQGLSALTERLRRQDRLAIVVYAGAAGVVLEPTAGNRHAAIREAIDSLHPGGSTNGSAGIERAYQLAQRHFIKGGINRVILATDGDFNVGVHGHDALVELIEAKRESGVYLSVLGVGIEGADATMEQLADHGNGNYAVLDTPLEARKVLVEESGAMLQTIAKDVKIQVEFDREQVAEHRLIGYENRRLEHRDFADDSKDAGEVGAGHSVTAIYEIVPTAEFGGVLDQSGEKPFMTLDLRYKQPESERSELLAAPLLAHDAALEDTSDDFRFAAAVAEFGQALHGVEGAASYAAILDLAEHARGSDLDCYRDQFVDLVWQAGTLAGETIARPDLRCPSTITPARRPEPRPALQPERQPERQPEPSSKPSSAAPIEHVIALAPLAEPQADWMSFVLEVLRLLPPLLALPFFVMASRRPRRARPV